MNSMHFTEKDKEDFVLFLNIIAKHAKFEMTTEEIIKYFKALSTMQQRILPKIDANILEVRKVVEATEDVPSKET